MPTKSFSGEIVVASRIVDYLSSGLYESPAACLKELVNNAFDADATKVHIYVKPDANRIIIEDNGHGLSKSEFIRHFSRISESHKRDDGELTIGKRKKIGKIGIGFVAANEICDEMEIYSTKKGEEEMLVVTINFANMRSDPVTRRRKGDEIAKGDYTGTVEKAEKGAHFTKIFLKSVRGEAKTILAGARRSFDQHELVSLYGFSAETVNSLLSRKDLQSWDRFDAYSQTMLKIGLNVPVRYHNHWLLADLQACVRSFQKHVERLNFAVFYDGTELRKPAVLFPHGKSAVIETFTLEGKNVSAQGYFYAQHGAIRPQELNGLLIRIRNAAVGEYDKTFLGFPITEGTLFQRWISMEIWADDRLEDAMNIDRKTLRAAHPAYAEMQLLLHDQLSKFLRQVRTELWREESESRRRLQVKDEVEKLRESLLLKFGERSEKDVDAIIGPWIEAAAGEKGRKKLLRKLSLPEVYQAVSDVAAEILDKKELKALLLNLSKRLQR